MSRAAGRSAVCPSPRSAEGRPRLAASEIVRRPGRDIPPRLLGQAVAPVGCMLVVSFEMELALGQDPLGFALLLHDAQQIAMRGTESLVRREQETQP